jgi:hypothetical protein
MQPDWVTDGCILEPSINERTEGWLDALPGCNPIQPGPEDARPVLGCGAPTTIGEPLHYYTDLTGSHGWEWVGCTRDNVGGQRILVGSFSGISDMTPARCVEKCIADGYSIAGVENSHECFCGNSVAEDKMPLVTPMGKCLQPCAGDSLQKCGGVGFIGLYRRCEGGCNNLQYPVVPH